MKKMTWVIVAVLCTALLLARAGGEEEKEQKANRGVIGSPATPDDPASAMYTAESIYQRLLNGSAGSKRETGFVEPTVSPGTATGHSTDDMMAIAPEMDDTNGARPADVAAGKTFWGLHSGYWGLHTGTSSGSGCTDAPVPQTGQTTSYGTGDDGDLQMGVAWPNPRFTDNGDGTVTDNLTGLIWLKNANCGGSKTWASALSYCNSMANGQCGLTDGSNSGDWRLPSLFELESLRDMGYYSPALSNTAGTTKWSEGDAFTGVQSSYYWSSTTYAYSTSVAWYVYFDNGYVDGYNKTSTLYVWPVRGGQ